MPSPTVPTLRQWLSSIRTVFTSRTSCRRQPQFAILCHATQTLRNRCAERTLRHLWLLLPHPPDDFLPMWGSVQCTINSRNTQPVVMHADCGWIFLVHRCSSKTLKIVSLLNNSCLDSKVALAAEQKKRTTSVWWRKMLRTKASKKSTHYVLHLVRVTQNSTENG